ncbi:MAG: TIGR04255 family protein [Solirubrobacteraceae bacterium]
MTAFGSLPDAPRFRLERPPLAQVVCQVRFSSVLKLQREPEVIPFQDAIRADYPRYTKTEAMSIVVTPAGVQQQPLGGTLYRFQDTSAAYTAVLSTDFIALETSGYVDIEDFASRVVALSKVIAEQYHPTEINRVGLRFINELRLGSTDPKSEMLSAITPALLGPIGTAELAASTINMQQVFLLRGTGTSALVRHGLNPEGGTTVDLGPGQFPGPEYADPFYLLDIDVFSERAVPFSVEGIDTLVRDFNENVRAVFAWAVNEEYRKNKLGQVEATS